MTADHLTIVAKAATGSEQKNGKVSLEILAKMTGFPVEMIRDEIFQGHDEQEVSLDDLRRAMLTYIDSTMLMDEMK
ncbi:MAG TPA: hypothetical protein VNJ01_16090 [Bacteriovoracaceae bacterium]|nr:hypothetical protein [Bacteriovoracaceae bacterium]